MADIRLSGEISDRLQFARLLREKRLLGTAVEVGVHRGEFAAHFLHHWPGGEYLAIDHYQDYEHLVDRRELDRRVSHLRLARYGERVKWIEEDSAIALRTLPPESADFVYLDADHAYWAVAEDIIAGWPRVRPGGILAGHDFDWQHPGVVAAVREFAERESVPVYLTREASVPWSWYCWKPGVRGERRGER